MAIIFFLEPGFCFSPLLLLLFFLYFLLPQSFHTSVHLPHLRPTSPPVARPYAGGAQLLSDPFPPKSTQQPTQKSFYPSPSHCSTEFQIHRAFKSISSPNLLSDLHTQPTFPFLSSSITAGQICFLFSPHHKTIASTIDATPLLWPHRSLTTVSSSRCSTGAAATPPRALQRHCSPAAISPHGKLGSALPQPALDTPARPARRPSSALQPASAGSSTPKPSHHLLSRQCAFNTRSILFSASFPAPRWFPRPPARRRPALPCLVPPVPLDLLRYSPTAEHTPRPPLLRPRVSLFGAPSSRCWSSSLHQIRRIPTISLLLSQSNLQSQLHLLFLLHSNSSMFLGLLSSTMG